MMIGNSKMGGGPRERMREDRGRLTEIEVKLREWENGPLKKSLDATPEREILSELPKKRLYTPLDMVDFDYLKDLGFPGEPPFVRGYSPTMYRSRLWDMAQYAGFGAPEDARKRYNELLRAGGGGVSIAYDLPSQLGYDADDPLVEAEVGLVGVSCCSLQDVEDIFANIPMDETWIRGSISTLSIVFWAMYLAAAARKGIHSEQLSGEVVTDCLHEFISRGNYIFPPEHAVRLSLDVMEYGLKHIPELKYQIVSYTLRERGATAVQEAAYALAASLHFLNSARDRGMDVENLARHFEIHTATHIDLFEEVAKIRAIKRMWSKLMKERFNPKDPKVLGVRLGPITGGSPLTAQEPENNIIRVTIAALAGALGGSNYLANSSFDEAHAIPSAKAAKIALRTLQIIGYESGVTDVVDPLGGSYYVESLTTELEKRTLTYLKEIEDRGGIVNVIETGWIQQEIARSAYIRQKEIDEGKRVIIGVNKFASDEKPVLETHEANPEIVEKQKRRLKDMKRKRENEAVRRSLEKVRRVARSKENLMPTIMEAVNDYATLGEICGILREIFGEYTAISY
jgi:methylmalonyl-CoA mutase N-terminal domain/subunit